MKRSRRIEKVTRRIVGILKHHARFQAQQQGIDSSHVETCILVLGRVGLKQEAIIVK